MFISNIHDGLVNGFLEDRKTRLFFFAVIVLATFLDGSDQTAIAVVLPEIAVHFGISAGDSSWIVTIYFLFMACLLLIFGKICTNGALKKILLCGFGFFTVGALFSSISMTYEMLLIARSIQGIGSGMLWCSAMMLGVRFLPKGLVALGFVATATGESLGSILGPAIGGTLAEMFSWEWMFLINIPIGILAFVLAWKIIPDDDFKGMSGFDYLGSVLLFLAVFSGIFCIETAAYDGVSTSTFVAVSVFMVTLFLFLLRTKRVDDPIIDLSLFKCHGVVPNLMIMISVIMCGMGVMYLLPYYMSKVLEFDTMESGLLILIPGVMTLIVCHIVGKLVVRFGSRPFVTVTCAIVTVLSACLLMVDHAPLPVLFASLILVGTLWGFSEVSIYSRLVNLVPDEKRCSCSALNTFVVYVSVSVGIALFFILMTIGSGTVGVYVEDLTPEAFTQGLTFAMSVGLVMSIFALIISLIAKDETHLE